MLHGVGEIAHPFLVSMSLRDLNRRTLPPRDWVPAEQTIEQERVLQTKHPVAALLMGAALIALIAGVTGWSMRSRSSLAADAEPQTVAPPASQLPPHIGNFRPSPVQLHAGAPDPRRLLANSAHGASKSITAARKNLQTRFASEPVDATWASRKEKALAAANESSQIEQLGAKPLAFDSQCHSSICVIGADFPTATAAEDWYTLYTLTAGPEMSRAAVQRTDNPDGTIHLQIYGQARN
jgi:hypothetical protein